MTGVQTCALPIFALVKGGAWTLAALNVLGTLSAAAVAGLLGAYVGARLGAGG